jgi:hypothetical protein
MRPLLGLVAILTISFTMTACGGSASSSTTTSPGSVTISPTSASVNVNSTVQFSATAANLSSTLVNWQVNDVQGGSSTTGTITTGGLYMAPSSVPSTNTVTVKAVAQSDSSVSASATVTILPAAAIIVSPGAASIGAGISQLFTATVSGGGSIAVTWEVNGEIGGDPAIGVISAAGVYKAPQIPPPGGTVMITAVSQSDQTVTASAMVTLLFSTFSLQNSYAFSLGGTITATGGFFLRAGSFTADGQGHILGGLEDLNQPSGVSQNVPFTGTYSIGADGRGTMQICEPSSSSCTSPTSNFQIVVVSEKQAQIIEFDVSATANGEMNLQDTSAFTFAGLSGTYTFDFFGLSSSQAPESVVGEFSADGSGGILSGQFDIDNGGTLTHLPILPTSTYSISANGRGLATIVTSSQTVSFSFYIVSTARAKFMELDSLPALSGDAYVQQTLVPWGVNSLNADFVFQTAGASTAGGIADAGRFTTDGNGNIVSGSGILDENLSGTLTLGATFSGSYTLDASGRGTFAFSNNFTYIFYMVSANKAVIQETDSSIVADGLLLRQQGAPFTAASLQDSYALNLAGLTAAGEEDFVGHLVADGAGNLPSGLLDINNFGSLFSAEPNSGTYNSVASNGRAAMVLNPSADNRNFVLYFVSPSQVFVLGTDSTRLASGSLYKQF